jgi:hypothetical protein
MQSRFFTNNCLLAIACLLAVGILRLNSGKAYAAVTSEYQVIEASEDNIPHIIQTQTKDGWELVAAPMWTYDEVHAKGLLVFRK